MLKHANKLTCEKFQRYVVELINSGADEDAERHRHARACATCRQFLREITIISDAAHSLFPEEWKTINRPN
jgi:hypothetical protein